MPNWNRMCPFIGALFAILLGTPGSGQAHVESSIRARLPATTRMVIVVPDVQQLTAKWNGTSLGKLLSGEQFESFRRELTSASRRGFRPLLASLDWAEINELATGPLLFAVGEQGEGSLFALTTSRRERTLKSMDDLASRLREKGAQVGTTSAGGVRVISIEFKQPTGKVLSRLIAYAHGVLYVSDNESTITRMLRESDGQGLDRLPAFQSIVLQTRDALPDADLFWWAQGDAINWLIGQQPVLQTSGATTGGMATLRTASDQGFNAFQAVGGGVALGDSSRDTVAETFVFQFGGLVKAARMMATSSLPFADDIPWDRQDFIRVTRWNPDWSDAIAGYGSWFDATYGDGEDGVFELVLDEIRDEPDSPQVDVRKEIFSQLGQYAVSCQFSDDSLGSHVRAYAIPIQNAARVSTAVGRLLQGDEDVTVKSIEDVRVWHYGDLKRSDDEPILGPDLSGWALSVVDNHFVITNDIRAMASLVANGANDSIVDAVRLVQKKMNANEQCGWQFQRIPDSIQPAYEAMRSGRAQDSFAGRVVMTLFRQSGNAERWSFASLPPAAALRTARGDATTVIKRTHTGWQLSTIVNLDE